MPFKNIGSDPEDDVFIDGVTADITTDLSRLSNLRVIANQTASSFSDRDISPQDAGRELDVKYILDGNVRRSGEDLRVNAQLIETDTGYSLWASRYDRRLQNIFEIQDEITDSIVKALSIRLSSQEAAAIRSIATTDVHAYELFLRGLKKFNSHIREDSESAIVDYHQAMEIDPGFARVYGALGVVLARNYRLGWTDAPRETIDRALAFAKQAVEIDDSVPQVYWALGYVHLHRKEFAEATKAVEQSIRLAPNYADGFGLLALIQNSQGNWQEAIGNVTRGMELNPYYSYDYPYNLGRAYFLGGRYEEAIDALAQALDKNPMAEMPRLYTIASLVRTGEFEEARWEAEQLSVLRPDLTLSGMRRTLSQNPELLTDLLADLEKAGVR
jgi:TolB-like protein/Flp pilus assembly protein TadD